MSHIAFIGTGTMGSRMAQRLLAAGHELSVWNRTRSRIEGLLALGAHEAGSPRAAAFQADIAITMVADVNALDAVTRGQDGLLAGLRPGSLLLEMSTSGPRAVLDLSTHLPPGVALLDAPVLGSLREVERGELHIFVGGAGDDFAKASPVLSALGTPLHVGPLGSGAKAKLLANASLIGVLGLLGEVLALSGGLGLPQDTAFTVLSRTPLAAQAERRRASVETGDYPPRFALSLARKDAELVTAAGEQAGLELNLLTAAADWLRKAEAAGLGERDYSAVVQEILGQSRKGL